MYASTTAHNNEPHTALRGGICVAVHLDCVCVKAGFSRVHAVLLRALQVRQSMIEFKCTIWADEVVNFAATTRRWYDKGQP